MFKHRLLTPLTLCLAIAAIAAPTIAQRDDAPPRAQAHVEVMQTDDGAILATDGFDTYVFQDINAYLRSDFFGAHGMHCGSVSPEGQLPAYKSTSDCSNSFTNPASQYAPSGGDLYRIPVVVHVITTKNGNGFISDATVQSQIDILNEDFLALAGSNGAPGTNARIEFFLADTDPDGNSTNGITRSSSNKWFNDSGNYANALNWDTNRYLNIYTNLAGGNLGYAYVPSGGGVVGTSFDGVRVLWSSFGANAPIGPPYNLGRTTTHEVGHYLGLYHTFDGGCASASGCNGNGDLICDTNPEGSPNGATCSRTTCGSLDPTHNYMDYSDDVCMYEFTEEQSRRMRCTLANFRVDLGGSGPPPGNTAPSVSIGSPSNGTSVSDGTAITFSGSASDAEDGNLSSSISWSSNLDGSLGSGASVNATLSVGNHTITASVTDSGNLSDSDQISVTVTSVGGGGITLSTNGYKVKGRLRVDLTWSGATGGSVDIYRDGAFLTSTANDGAYTDETGLKGGGSLTYQVCASGDCSNNSVVNY